MHIFQACWTMFFRG